MKISVCFIAVNFALPKFRRATSQKIFPVNPILKNRKVEVSFYWKFFSINHGILPFLISKSRIFFSRNWKRFGNAGDAEENPDSADSFQSGEVLGMQEPELTAM